MLKIKLFSLFAFLTFAGSAFLFSSNGTRAQSSENVKKRDDVLEKVAGYKNWKQVQKPEKKSDVSVVSDVLSISDSTLAG